ncbi:hypothetical protein PGT21_022070 [Puccinia graminis f. sp. tritici]|uniref:Uncharacterized protein n=1 Tax=Puccinia graminis f. sp. tritici TaxID=56615 RepID=A0A5B0NVQ2_PUCGR|nr:hypothetical protein PGT21_022070 [Puccinia graminis f. sp. tritici]
MKLSPRRLLHAVPSVSNSSPSIFVELVQAEASGPGPAAPTGGDQDVGSLALTELMVIVSNQLLL